MAGLNGKPVALDEYPVHQAPQSMGNVVPTDRNFYDRYYFNAHDRTGDVFLVTGMGTYPNLGVIDAYVTVRHGDRQWAVRFSDTYEHGDIRTDVGGYRIEVIEPLHKLRVVCDHPDVSMDMTWEGSFPAELEEQHTLMAGPRAVLDATRFAQVGCWSGSLTVGDTEFTVDPYVWLGSRDRSWGIRPVGEPDPKGRQADEPSQGHWWAYVPLRFDDFMLLLIVQEGPDGYRTLNHATRVFADGTVQQLGWPQIEISYRSGTRHPDSARIHLATPAGEPLLVDVETLGFVALTVGAGYGVSEAWHHGQWMGRDWSSSDKYDLTDPGVLAMLPYAHTDHVARATCDGKVGHGMFEHAVIGRHDPSGFTGYTDMAP